jgi:pyranose oxidase
VDVCIAGSGPIAAAYASTIIENHPTATVLMVEIGSQDSLIAGEHHKNTIKYQKDIDSFVNVIKGALQPISIPPSEAYISTLGGTGWSPGSNQVLVTEGHNPNQRPEVNLRASAVTRTVGGMATHWTCACPEPNSEERQNNPIENLQELLQEAKDLLNVHSDQYDHSIRHTVVKEALQRAYPDRGITSLPLAVERRTDNPDYVTWTGTHRLLSKALEAPTRFKILTETRFTKLVYSELTPDYIQGALIRDLRGNCDKLVLARAYVVACGAVGTPQVLFNSKIHSPTLGHHLSEQSLAFCQIVLKRSIVDSIPQDPRFAERVRQHHEKYPKDPLPIPFNDPEPQVMIPYNKNFPWHVQVHRDAFSYGDIGPKADPRVIVDLRFFGKQDIIRENQVYFGPPNMPLSGWNPGVSDIYGMPQATFEVTRSNADAERDQRMMRDMTDVANVLGSFLPGSAPQFMEPGLALHITGTTRIGNDPETSVADANSKVHGKKNLWLGGNGCIPDSTACNPTRTSVAIALQGARSIVRFLKERDA